MRIIPQEILYCCCCCCFWLQGRRYLRCAATLIGYRLWKRVFLLVRVSYRMFHKQGMSGQYRTGQLHSLALFYSRYINDADNMRNILQATCKNMYIGFYLSRLGFKTGTTECLGSIQGIRGVLFILTKRWMFKVRVFKILLVRLGQKYYDLAKILLSVSYCKKFYYYYFTDKRNTNKE